MAEIFIHIGLHRTGSTFLQKRVFPNIEGITYYGRYNPYLVQNYALLIDEERFEKVLISDEGLTTYPYLKYPESDCYKISDRLKTLYPSAKIILVLRNKEEWKKSLFNFYIKIGGTYSFSEWKDEIFDKKNIDFNDYGQYLKNKFDDVLILWYYELKNNPDDFIRRICDFMNVKYPDFNNIYENQSYNKKANNFLKRLKNNKFLPSIIRSFFDGIFKKISI